ncbi:MAG: hypothetical protein WBU92_01165 [Candidatus Dormiibacterota bacterium]
MLSSRLLGVILSGVVLAGCGSLGSPTHSTAGAAEPANQPLAPMPGSAPRGFQAVDLTWISSSQGWALGVEPGCGGQRCATILETTDGGRQWVTVSDLHGCLAEAAPVGCPAGLPEVSAIRFANPDVGYAFTADGGPYLVTANGGLSWTSPPGQLASAVKLAAGTAVRVSFSKEGCPGPCDWSVDVASVGQSSWRSVLRPPMAVNHAGVVLLHQGPEYLYVAFLGDPASGPGSQPAQLFVSSDAGASWAGLADPCSVSTPAYISTLFSAAPGGVLAALCVPRSGKGRDAVTVSTDAGATFGPLRPLPHAGAPYSELALTSPQDLFAAVGGTLLVTSRDSGRKWRVLLRERSGSGPVPQFLGFESPTVGRWLGAGSELWTTSDGGSSWRALRF